MTTYVIRNGQLIDKSLLNYYDNTPKVHIISDTMDETRHMGDGRYYTSKSEFRKATKACDCVEIGNDSSLYKQRTKIPLSREQRREDIKHTIYNLRNGIK